MNFAAGANAGTFTFGSTVVFSPGDILQIAGPASADATFGDVGGILTGTY